MQAVSFLGLWIHGKERVQPSALMKLTLNAREL